jgi:hypothetical protein
MKFKSGSTLMVIFLPPVFLKKYHPQLFFETNPAVLLNCHTTKRRVRAMKKYKVAWQFVRTCQATQSSVYGKIRNP